jgi:biotin-(acetyl-CoA carboxylase) ligase
MTLEPLLQDRDFALASHQWSGRQRRGQRWLTPEKAIALLSDRDILNLNVTRNMLRTGSSASQ